MTDHRTHGPGPDDGDALSSDEQSLLDELRDAGRLDAPPAEAVAAAKSSIVWRTLDAELAELVYDSVMDDAAMAGVRSGQGPQMLTFESPAVTVEIESAAVGARRRLVGQVVPPHPGRIEVRHSGGRDTIEVDGLGRFAADDVTPGPVSLAYRAAGQPVEITTDWVLV